MTQVDEVLDARNLVCPMPVLLTRKKLEQMKNDKVLEVIVDYQAARDNIQRFVKEQGYEVLDVINEQKQFKILIKKKR